MWHCVVCDRMWQYVCGWMWQYVCDRMWKYECVCDWMWQYVRVCDRMWQYVVCDWMWQYVCDWMWQYVCLWQNVRIWMCLWQNVTICLWQNVTIYVNVYVRVIENCSVYMCVWERENILSCHVRLMGLWRALGSATWSLLSKLSPQCVLFIFLIRNDDKEKVARPLISLATSSARPPRQPDPSSPWPPHQPGPLVSQGPSSALGGRDTIRFLLQSVSSCLKSHYYLLSRSSSVTTIISAEMTDKGL